MELSKQLKKYILKEALSGLSRLVGDVGAEAKLFAKLADASQIEEFAKLSKNLEQFGIQELEAALRAAKNEGRVAGNFDFNSLKATIRQATASGDPGQISAAIAKAKAINNAVELESSAGKLSKIAGAAGDTAGAGKAAGAAGDAAAAGKAADLPSNLTIAQKVAKAKELDDAATEAKALGATSEQISLIRAERDAILKRGPTRKFKDWISDNKGKAIVLALSAGMLGMYGFQKKGDKISPTPVPIGGGGGGGGKGKGGEGEGKACKDAEMKKGCKGDNVRVLKSYLSNMGYDIVVNSVYDSKTTAIVKRFQKDFGISPANGNVNQATLDKIEEVRTKGIKTKEKQSPEATSDTSSLFARAELEKAAKEKAAEKAADPNMFGKPKVNPEVNESLMRKRHNQVEKLVFERLVKGCK